MNKAKLYLNEREFNLVMKKLFGAVGRKFSSIKEDCSTENWFLKDTWSKKQEKEFRVWLTEYLTSKLNLSPQAIRKRVEMFCFNYGWKYKD